MVTPDIERLYAAELPAVYGFLVRSGVRGPEVQDLAHEVFVTAIRRWSTYDPSRPPRPWLFGIAHRLLSDARRRASRTRETGGELPDVADERDVTGDRLREREAQALVNEALQSLDLDRRTVFIMCDVEGLAPADVAVAMDAKLATTYSRLRVAREEFTAAVRRIRLKRGES
jgi:RNA polymerase sigma-70 factor (ECF subfamily)